MRLLFISFVLSVSTPLKADVFSLTQTLLENAAEKTMAPMDVVDSLYPHYLVYGFEVSKSAGLGDVFEVEGAFGAEFHFERVEAP